MDFTDPEIDGQDHADLFCLFQTSKCGFLQIAKKCKAGDAGWASDWQVR